MLGNFNKKNLKTITQEEFDKLIEEHKKLTHKIHDNGLHLSNYNLSNIKIKNKALQYISIFSCLLNNVVFENCDLKSADIRYSKIINTSFTNCNLLEGNFDCNFINTDLSTCDIKKCNFNDSSLDNTTMPDYPMACPEKGSFIGYKKVYNIINDRYQWFILKLEIPEDARRNAATNNKCRCDKAKVLKIQNLDGSIAKGITKARSIYNNGFIYELGKIVEEPKFDECRWYEYTSGIHFFMNREEAVNYMAF